MRTVMRSHKGFTLIELMIGLALGVFVVGGIYTVLVGNTSTYTVVQSSSVLHEDARTSMLYLRRQFHMAGWRSEADIEDVEADLQGNFVVFAKGSFGGVTFADNQVISGSDGPEPTVSDTLTLRYRGTNAPDAPLDCAGNSLAEGETATIRFSVDQRMNLVCQDLDTGNSEIILENVERFKVLYYQGSQYVTAATAAADNFASTSRIRFALMLRGEKPAQTPFERRYSILGQSGESEDYNDKIFREVFQETVSLYNNVN